jgi:FKBP-type peptidyl-prolyl cis-trans isomerase FkpA
MKRTLSVTIFLLLAAGIVWLALWYNQMSDQQAQQAEIAANAAAQQAQSQIMQNLKINDVVVGTGATAENGDSVTVNYVGTLDDGMVFDSSYARNQPFTFTLGAGDVIKGWDLGVVGMKVGGKRGLTIPPELAYETSGVPQANIPPNATLHFTVELLSVQAPSSTGQ